MPTRFKYFSHVALTLLLALCAALLCVALGTPLPWMIGPLLATALATIFRQPTQSAIPLRNAAQCTLGAALGLYFTPTITALVLSLWWAIAIGIVWSLLLGWGFGLWLHKLNAPHLRGLTRSTTWFAGAIGGASEMTLLAERVHARTDLVAASHSMRLLLVTVLVPFGMQFSGLQGLGLLNTGAREVSFSGLAVLGGTTLLGAWVMDRLGRANPWFIGALLVSMGFAMAGVELTAIPKPLSNAAQLLIGLSLGVRFTPAFVHTAPRWLATVAAGTVGMIGLCVGFGLWVAWATDLHPATMVLATAPGGIAEMSITAKVLQLGAPVVTAFQVCRLMAVLLIVQPIHTWLYAGKD